MHTHFSLFYTCTGEVGGSVAKNATLVRHIVFCSFIIVLAVLKGYCIPTPLPLSSLTPNSPRVARVAPLT